MAQANENLTAVAYDALRGDEPSQNTIAYLYAAGGMALNREDLPNLEEAWEILAQAKRVIEICEAGVSHELINACDPERVNLAKGILNQADEQIPGAYEKAREVLSAALDSFPQSPDFETVWSRRNEPVTRMQIVALIATNLPLNEDQNYPTPTGQP